MAIEIASIQRQSKESREKRQNKKQNEIIQNEVYSYVNVQWKRKEMFVEKWKRIEEPHASDNTTKEIKKIREKTGTRKEEIDFIFMLWFAYMLKTEFAVVFLCTILFFFCMHNSENLFFLGYIKKYIILYCTASIFDSTFNWYLRCTQNESLNYIFVAVCCLLLLSFYLVWKHTNRLSVYNFNK